MKIENAIKKLEKNGFQVAKVEGMNRYYKAIKKGFRHFIAMHEQSGQVIIIDVRRHGEEDDTQNDYHAGSFAKNITEAIRWAND